MIGDSIEIVSHKPKQTKKKQCTYKLVPSVCYFCIGSCIIMFVIVPISVFITKNELNFSTIKPM